MLSYRFSSFRQTRELHGCCRAVLNVKSQYDVKLSEATNNHLLRHSFTPLKLAQMKYERCEEIDTLAWRHFIDVSIPFTPAPTLAELELRKRSVAYISSSIEFRRIKGSLNTYPTVQMFSSTEGSFEGGLVWGKCLGDIDESPEVVLAWLWQLCSYERIDVHRKYYGDLVRRTDASELSRSQTFETEYSLAPGIANRRTQTKYTWFQRDASGDTNHQKSGGYLYAIAFEPAVTRKNDANSATGGFSKNSVVAISRGVFLFERITQRSTKMTMVQRADMGGKMQVWVMNSLVAYALSLIVDVQEKFRRADQIVDKVGIACVIALVVLLRI